MVLLLMIISITTYTTTSNIHLLYVKEKLTFYLEIQHRMTRSCLGRQFTTVYYQVLEALSQVV